MGFIDPIAIGSAIPASAVALVPSWPLPIFLIGMMAVVAAIGAWAAAARREPSDRRVTLVRPATAS